MAGTMMKCWRTIPLSFVVSMESGLDGRNNRQTGVHVVHMLPSQWSPA